MFSFSGYFLSVFSLYSNSTVWNRRPPHEQKNIYGTRNRNTGEESSISSKSITYSPAFKINAVEQSKNGVTAPVIFEEVGLPEPLIGEGKAHQSLRRWKKSMAKQGQDAILQKTRGKGSRPIGNKEISLEEKLAKTNACIVYIEGKLTLVKKLELHERSVKNGKKAVLKTNEWYALINHIISEYQLEGMVKQLCEIAEVSRSGYYYWLNNEENRIERYESDWADYKLFYHVFIDKKKCGGEEIKMTLENEYDLVINHKKIRRILRMNGVISPIRKAKPYRKIMIATQEHKTKKNLGTGIFTTELRTKCY